MRQARAGAVALLVRVGFVAVAPEPTTGLARAEEPALALRVVSYNTWLFPLAADEVAARRDRMGPALDALAPDVLCLQELWDKGGVRALRGALGACLPYGQIGGGGLAIASRWPIVDARSDAHPEHAGLSLFERLSKKGRLAVVIATPAGYVRVVTSHTAFERGGGGDGRAAHRAQIDALVEALAHDRRLPTIVCGDLNFRAVVDGAPSEELAALRGIGFEDAAGTAPGPDGRWSSRRPTRHGWPRTGPRRGGDPDYVIVRDGRAHRLEVRGYRHALDSVADALSDHDALVVDLAVRAREPRRGVAVTP